MIIGNPIMLGGAKAFAVIGVTYPEGSTCTCSDGTKTLKLKDTSGQGIFLIPYAATWTVAATDGTNTKSESVEITSEGQSKSVSISYRLYLYKLGDEFTDITNGWNATLSDYTHKYGTYLRVSRHANNDGTFGGYFSTGKAIDLTEYNNLCCYATLDRTHNRINGIVGIVSSATTGSFTSPYQRDAEAYTSSETEAQIIKADISGLTGMHYIHFVAGTPISSYGCADEIWLE